MTKAGREARLLFLHVAIRGLLQIKFLPCPRTQNPPDLAAVYRALVGGRRRAFHLFRYGIKLGGRTVQCRPVLVINHEVKIRIIFTARLYCDYFVACDVTRLLRRLLGFLPRRVEEHHIIVKLTVFSPNRRYLNDGPFSERMIIRKRPDARKRKTKESRKRGETVFDCHKFPRMIWNFSKRGLAGSVPRPASAATY